MRYRMSSATIPSRSASRCYIARFSGSAHFLVAQGNIAELAEQASDEAASPGGTDRNKYARTLLGFFETLHAAPAASGGKAFRWRKRVRPKKSGKNSCMERNGSYGSEEIDSLMVIALGSSRCLSHWLRCVSTTEHRTRSNRAQPAVRRRHLAAARNCALAAQESIPGRLLPRSRPMHRSEDTAPSRGGRCPSAT